MAQQDVGINVKNFVAIGLMALLFIVGAKIVFTKIDIPGLSPVVKSA